MQNTSNYSKHYFHIYRLISQAKSADDEWCNGKHYVKSVHIRSHSGPYFFAFGLKTERSLAYLSVFSPNAGKYGPECLRIRTLFTQ